MDKSSYVVRKINPNKKIILERKPEVYLTEVKAKYPNLSEEQIYYKARNSIEKIFTVIDSFEEYRIKIQKKAKQKTVKGETKFILRFIGWYKAYKQLVIDELDIKEIIPVINPYLEEYDFNSFSEEEIQKISLKEWYLRRSIKAKTKDFKTTVNNFIASYLINAKSKTKETYLECLITFAKYLYRNITDTEENDDYQDISLINKLKVLLRDIYNIKDFDEETIIPFSWDEILLVLKRLKKEADQKYTYHRGKKNNKGIKFSKKSKALHIQDFLVIAFFCVMPPDRQRTFRELTFGETLKYGIRNKINNTFISYENLKEGETPKYYIHLLPHQYKTGDIYGTYWHEIKNFDFGDGTKFYDYLNKWFFEGYRDELVSCHKTDAVFIRPEKGNPFREQKESEFCNFIKHIFLRKTKFPLNPHALRTIYVTHLNNLNVPEPQRKAIAYMMHHDLDTANKTYNKQTMEEKIALGVEFINQQILV